MGLIRGCCSKFGRKIRITVRLVKGKKSLYRERVSSNNSGPRCANLRMRVESHPLKTSKHWSVFQDRSPTARREAYRLRCRYAETSPGRHRHVERLSRQVGPLTKPRGINREESGGRNREGQEPGGTDRAYPKEITTATKGKLRGNKTARAPTGSNGDVASRMVPLRPSDRRHVSSTSKPCINPVTALIRIAVGRCGTTDAVHPVPHPLPASPVQTGRTPYPYHCSYIHEIMERYPL